MSNRPHNRSRMWSGRVLAKYWALQLPATALVGVIAFVLGEAFAWPWWVAWMILVAALSLDAILYPILWRSYDVGDPAAFPYPMEGAEGIAIDRIDQSGHVRIWSERWSAELARGARAIEAGEAVRVKARSGLMLTVEPLGG